MWGGGGLGELFPGSAHNLGPERCGELAAEGTPKELRGAVKAQPYGKGNSVVVSGKPDILEAVGGSCPDSRARQRGVEFHDARGGTDSETFAQHVVD
jgi:hypothetical protein